MASDPLQPAPLTRRPLDMRSHSVPHGRVIVVAQRCKECGFCWELCPNQVLERSEGRNAGGYRYPRVRADRTHLCVDCRNCHAICPDLAIFTIEDGKTEVVL